jgi:hypothetical protein
MSRLVIAMLAAALALGVAGCGGGESQAESIDSAPKLARVGDTAD